ncbi:MAG TPA: efflux transporter outer membrane subunit [Bryobacteraceae bacterium]|nr:efflux transporter outer membrane subunit [Bryobacteraceae bacterium]
MKRPIAAILICATTAAAAGWPKVGPDYHPPKAAVPGSYHDQSAGATTDPAVSDWWTTLNDPELTALVHRAVTANLDLKIAASRVVEARAARGASRADLLPNINNQDTAQRVRGGLTSGLFNVDKGPSGASSLLTPFESNVFQFGFDASWEIDLFGGRRRALEAATADVVAADEARRATLVSLLAEVARNYAELRGFQRRLDITEHNIELQQDSLDLTRVRADAGLGTQLDVERQAAQLASTRALVPVLEAAEIQSIHRIGVLLGEEPGALLHELTEAKPLPAAPPIVPAGLPSDLLKRRPDIREAEARLHAETARVGVARADLFPRFFLNGASGRQSTALSGVTLGAGNFFSAGPAVSLPFFTGGKIHANIAAQQQRLDQALAAYQNTILRSLEETENSLTAYGHEKDRRERLLAEVEASRQATSLANEVYTRGLADFLSVLDAQRQQLSAEDDLAQSDTAVVTDLIAIYKSLGGGW